MTSFGTVCPSDGAACGYLRPSETRTGLFQKLDFFLRGFPAQDGVPMRIPPEPLDDCLVFQLVIEVALDSIPAEQLHGDFVYFHGFAVHEGHVEEAALDRIQGFIRAG